MDENNQFLPVIFSQMVQKTVVVVSSVTRMNQCIVNVYNSCLLDDGCMTSTSSSSSGSGSSSSSSSNSGGGGGGSSSSSSSSSSSIE
jgi:uncharacterized membrane protein YgcG